LSRDSKRMITEGDLLEVSLVAIHANAEAVIEIVKSTPGPREIEAALKAAGLSNRQARAAAVGAVKALAAKDPNNEQAALAAAISDARGRIALILKRQLQTFDNVDIEKIVKPFVDYVSAALRGFEGKAATLESVIMIGRQSTPAETDPQGMGQGRQDPPRARLRLCGQAAQGDPRS
jgi:hypothetical protein